MQRVLRENQLRRRAECAGRVAKRCSVVPACLFACLPGLITCRAGRAWRDNHSHTYLPHTPPRPTPPVVPHPYSPPHRPTLPRSHDPVLHFCVPGPGAGVDGLARLPVGRQVLHAGKLQAWGGISRGRGLGGAWQTSAHLAVTRSMPLPFHSTSFCPLALQMWAFGFPTAALAWAAVLYDMTINTALRWVSACRKSCLLFQRRA